MDHSKFVSCLQRSVVAAIRTFCAQHEREHPYAFAIISGQLGNYLGFAIATEERLQRTATKYDSRGYRYESSGHGKFDNVEKLSIWLRWANPDDGWLHGNFPNSDEIKTELRRLFDDGVFSDENGSFEEFCTDEVLGSLVCKSNWSRDPLMNSLIVGFTYGEDPRDFLRSATRANPYPLVQTLWSQHYKEVDVEARIVRPTTRRPK